MFFHYLWLIVQGVLSGSMLAASLSVGYSLWRQKNYWGCAGAALMMAVSCIAINGIVFQAVH